MASSSVRLGPSVALGPLDEAHRPIDGQLGGLVELPARLEVELVGLRALDWPLAERPVVLTGQRHLEPGDDLPGELFL